MTVTTRTIREAVDHFGIDVLDHLDMDVSIPVLQVPQCQGDLIVLPVSSRPFDVTPLPVPEKGLPVVRGENGGNTHTLVADGDVLAQVFTPSGESLDVCYLAVAPGSVAYLAHPEHAYAGIGPGCYVIRRQREQSDVIRTVAD